MVDYERTPKRRFTRLLLDLVARDGCGTFGSLWGQGGEARLAVEAGLSVLAADNDPTTFAAMAEDAARVGYESFAGNVRSLRRRVDVWHADFMGTPSPENFKTVRHLARLTDKWLAVTVATDHMKNAEMQGDAVVATLPAWLTFAAEGFTLEYLSTYSRNDHGLRMWVAILRRRLGRGNSHRVQPIQISWSMAQRGYWGSRRMFEEFPDLLPHRTGVASDNRTEYLKTRYWDNRDKLLQKSRDFYRSHAEDINAKQRARRATDPLFREHQRAYQRKWRAAHPSTPEQRANRKEYRRSWYLANRDKQIAAAKAYRSNRHAERHAEAG